MPSLQHRGLLSALHKQDKAGLIASDVAEQLATAYGFLRRVEHMLQYREDEQTHLLPHDPKMCTDLAHAMGMAPTDFENQLASLRAFVSRTFRNAFRIAGMGSDDSDRSEEHTYELQSLMRNSYAVFRLKKKNQNIKHIKHIK